jgi:membrane-anchored protein YejM (alkaline phosphatase superfamily)
MKYQKIEEYINIVKFNLNNHDEIEEKMTRNYNFFNNFMKKISKHFSELELEDNGEIDDIISSIEVIENKINKEIIKSDSEYKKYMEKNEKGEEIDSKRIIIETEKTNVGFSDISILANKNHLKRKKKSTRHGYFD